MSLITFQLLLIITPGKVSDGSACRFAFSEEILFIMV